MHPETLNAHPSPTKVDRGMDETLRNSLVPLHPDEILGRVKQHLGAAMLRGFSYLQKHKKVQHW